MPNYQGTAASTSSGPPYGSGGTAPASVQRLTPGAQIFLFQAESVTAPQASVEVELPPCNNGGQPEVCVEVLFSGAPGTFSVQLQEADTNCDGFFITPSAAAFTIAAVTANQVARADFAPVGGRYLRVLVATLTNAVKITVKVTRLN